MPHTIFINNVTKVHWNANKPTEKVKWNDSIQGFAANGAPN